MKLTQNLQNMLNGKITERRYFKKQQYNVLEVKLLHSDSEDDALKNILIHLKKNFLSQNCIIKFQMKNNYANRLCKFIMNTFL